MKQVTIQDKTYSVPERLEELTCDQYAYYCILIMLMAAGVDDELTTRRKLLMLLIGKTRHNYHLYLPRYAKDIDAQLHATDGFFVERNGRRVLDTNTTMNLLPEYHGIRSRVDDWLDGLTFGQFVECLTVLEGVEADGSNIAAAYAHVARVLYELSDDDEVPEVLLFHAPLLVMNVWKAILAGPVQVNGQLLDLRIIFKSTGERKLDDKTGWTGITFEVANAGLFGTVKEVEKTDFWLVLIYLYRCKFEYLNEQK